MTQSSRPLSPHLQIYKPQLTSVLSILHRITGMALAAGAVLFTAWLLAVASGPDAFAVMQSFFAWWFGQLVLLGFSFALFFHLCNGVRHLLWDAGIGLDIADVYRSGWLMLFCSVALTAGVWAFAFALVG